MVGLFVQQHFLPFYEGLLAESERFQTAKAEAVANQWFRGGKFEEPAGKGRMLGFGDFIKSMKNDNDNGNATAAEVEDLLNGSKMLSLKWKTSSCICIVLAEGTIVYLHAKNIHTNEFYFVVDRFFRFTEPAVSVAYSNKHIIFMFTENRLLILRKESLEDESGERSELIQPEVAVNNYNDLLPNLVSKKIEKKVTINDKSDLFMVWWSGSKDDVFPWSPKPEQRANILIYTLDEADPTLVSFLKTDANLLEASFIPSNFNHVITLEQSSDFQGCIVINEVIHEITRGKLTSMYETAIPLQSELKCYGYDEKKRKLALGCCDGSLVIYTQEGKVTHFTKASFTPCSVSWHNDGFLVFLAGERGQFQIFDIALSPLLLLDGFESSPSLAKELVPAHSVEKVCWSPIPKSSTDSFLLLRFDSGVLVLLRLAIGRVRLTQLCNFHLTNEHWPEAVKALKSVCWNSDECLHVMYQVFTYLMQRQYSEEVEYNLEHLLATYFVPSVPMEECIRKRHARSMRILARKFFMWLLRAKKYQRALQIATSLGEEGLLRKLHIVTLSQGDVKLASEINKKLQQYAVSSSDSRSTSDSEDHSQSSYSTSSDSSGINARSPLTPVSVTIPRPELLVLEPPSPYRNPTVEPPITKPQYYYFGENTSTSVAENALISENNIGRESGSSSSTIEVINFGPV